MTKKKKKVKKASSRGKRVKPVEVLDLADSHESMFLESNVEVITNKIKEK